MRAATRRRSVAQMRFKQICQSMQDIAKAITHGSLMGARGNSGVITSQILRGIAEGLCDVKNPEAVTPKDIAHAFRRGKEVAFKAVRKPVEGTILTVLKDVSAKADSLEKSQLTPVEVLDALVVEAYESVARTPELLPVLKENGVVDSGAFGFATFLEGFVNAVTGKTETTDFQTTVSVSDAKAATSAKVEIELNDDWKGSWSDRQKQQRQHQETSRLIQRQTMNPSTADILAAIEEANADQVIVILFGDKP